MRPLRALAALILLGLAVAGCTATGAGPSAGLPSGSPGAAALPALDVQPSGKTAAEVIAALPKALSGRPRGDGVPREATVAARPATINSYRYQGKDADDYVAIQIATTPEAGTLFPAGVARLAQVQTFGGALCGVGGSDGARLNVCYALLNDGVLTVTEPPDGKLSSLGGFTDRLSRAAP